MTTLMAILLDICVVTDDKHGRQKTAIEKKKGMGDPSLQRKPKWRNQAHVQLCKIFCSTVTRDPEYC